MKQTILPRILKDCLPKILLGPFLIHRANGKERVIFYRTYRRKLYNDQLNLFKVTQINQI